MKLSVLMTVYNEAEFVDYAIRACLPYVDSLVIVEGAYQETMKLGASPRSNDGTCEIVKEYVDNEKVFLIEANEYSDPNQRNVGLKKIKELNPEGFLLIVDGDEIFEKETFLLIKKLSEQMEKNNIYACYFQSLTFVNDINHYTLQKFPRLYKITSQCNFFSDNFMTWNDAGVTWEPRFFIERLNIKYYHYSFCKSDKKRTKLKKDWWENRFGSNYMNTGKRFEYDWYFDGEQKIYSPNHKIYDFVGRHPKIMESHQLWVKSIHKKI